MNEQKADEVLNMWIQCKKKSFLYDPLTKKNKIDTKVAKDLFIESLEAKNFECIGEGAYKLVFSKKSVDFVVKIYHTGSIDDREDKRFKLTKYCVKFFHKDAYISIQPKVKRNSKNKAYIYLEKKLGKHYCELYDVHPDNVGWLNNKAVIFDFIACSP